MKAPIAALLLGLLLTIGTVAQTPLAIPNGLPAWAFNIPDKVQPPGPEPKGVVRVPGSSVEYEWTKIAGNANPPDWFPEEHPPAPKIITGEPGST